MRNFIFSTTNRVRLLVSIFALIAFILTDAIADRAASAQAHNVSVVNDEERGAVRFMIDGREVARFTAQGLQVRDNVKYGGIIADTGPDSFDEQEAR